MEILVYEVDNIDGENGWVVMTEYEIEYTTPIFGVDRVY